ncbi:MAG: hypothetical protein JXB62_02080 [Pirellulales bacterium]|nr:hypothetical protein [Pirellulales bacterium]
MGSRIVDVKQEETKRDLRLRIARLRRQINGRIRVAQNETRRLFSWRTYVRRFPGSSVTAALGVGLALAAGLSTRRLSRWVGMRMVRRAADHVTDRIWRELRQVWTDSTPDRGTMQTGGADDERT